MANGVMWIFDWFLRKTLSTDRFMIT